MKNHQILLPESSTYTISVNNKLNFTPLKLASQKKEENFYPVLWTDGRAATSFIYPFRSLFIHLITI